MTIPAEPVDFARLDALFEPGWFHRCDYCGWPLAAGIREGCTIDNCSMRPMPSNADTPRKVIVRAIVALARRAQELERVRLMQVERLHVYIEENKRLEAQLAGVAKFERQRWESAKKAGLLVHRNPTLPQEPPKE